MDGTVWAAAATTAVLPLYPQQQTIAPPVALCATSGHSRTAAEVQAILATIDSINRRRRPSRATKPTTVVRYIIIIPVQASDPFAVALLERFGECGFRCFVACAITRNDPDRAYTLN